MKKMMILVMFAFALIGCQTTGMNTIPNLKGTWEVDSYSHHHATHGYLETNDTDSKWIVTGQEGRHFHGERVYVRKKIDGREFKEGFSGVIGRNSAVYIADHEEDVIIGNIVSDNELELYILGKTHAIEEAPRAGYVNLKRMGK